MTEQQILDWKEKNQDARADQIRLMAWIFTIAFVLYPLVIIGISFFESVEIIDALTDISSMFLGTVGAIILGFMGSEAYKNKKGTE